MRHIRLWSAVLIVLWVLPDSAAWAANRSSTASPPFMDSQVVAFVGDSITHNGLWHRYIADYYATRFPDRTVQFINGGISGDTAGGVLGRLEADILRHRPDAVVVMLGMNDVGRSHYKADADPETIARRVKSLESYRADMATLADRLKSGGVKQLIFVTPSPFDQTAQIETENLPGVNDALADCGAFVVELAETHGAGWVDFNAPMTELNQKLQQSDRSFTLVGADRVHPGAQGHLVMAWLFLKAQGAPAVVSRTDLDARKHKVIETFGGVLEGLVWEENGLSFTLTEQSLPWPIEEEARNALLWAPISEELNRQELRIRELSEGAYELVIDGQPVGNWSADEFSVGINLALTYTTPQMKQAMEILRLSEQRRNIQRSLRNVAMVEMKWFKGKVDMKDRQAVTAAMNAYIEQSGGYADYNRHVAASFWKVYPEIDTLPQRVEELTTHIRQIAQPVAHRYRLRPRND